MQPQAERGRLRIRKGVLTGLFAAAAMVLSCVEHILPLSLIIPVPGVRLGLSNIAVIAAIVFVSPASGAAVAAMKLSVPLLISGNGIAFLFSLCGTLLSYCLVMLARILLSGRISFIGACAISSASHAAGQFIICRAVIGKEMLWYLPLLLGTSVLTGIITGTIMNFCSPVLLKLKDKYLHSRQI